MEQETMAQEIAAWETNSLGTELCVILGGDGMVQAVCGCTVQALCVTE